MRLVTTLVLGATLMGGCEPLASLGYDPDLTYVRVADVPARINDKLDVMFVVDNSSAIGDRQLAWQR